MAAIEFYNVKKHKKVQLDEASCSKVKYERETSAGKKQTRYAVCGKDDGTNVTKFINKDTYDSLSCRAK